MQAVDAHRLIAVLRNELLTRPVAVRPDVAPAARLRKPETVTLRDLLDADVQVIALERFYPLGGQMVEKGRCTGSPTRSLKPGRATSRSSFRSAMLGGRSSGEPVLARAHRL